MTIIEILKESERLGLKFRVVSDKLAGDKLAVYPKDLCPDDFRKILIEHRDELIKRLKGTEALVRGMRDHVYGVKTSDKNWKECGDNWMRSLEWLEEQIEKEPGAKIL